MPTAHPRLRCARMRSRPTNATDSVSLVREWLYNRRSELAAANIGTNCYGYAYDTIGNRLWSAENAVTNSYTANNLNQYTSVAASTNLAYDADGNLTSDGHFSYSYDAENRLIAAYPLLPVVGSLAVVNRYDHKHRRVQKIVKQYDGATWETVETHTFIWDGNNIVLEKIVFADGTTRTCEYFWGADKSGTEQGAGGVEGLLAVSIDGVFYIPCYDHNGNIVLYVSENGSVAAQYTYDPYGNVIDSYGNLADVFYFGFSTQYHDRETGMVGYKRRFYRPDLGRWLNRDPIEEDGGENLYAFCRNRTTYEIDMLGTSTCCREGKKITCSNAYNWNGSVTVASATWLFGATFLMIDLVSNYICKTCTRFRLHAEAVLPTVAGGAPIALTGSNVEFRNVTPDAFVGTVIYGAAGIGAMGVAEASFLKLGSASLFSAGIVGGGEFGAGMGIGWYVNFELTEE